MSARWDEIKTDPRGDFMKWLLAPPRMKPRRRKLFSVLVQRGARHVHVSCEWSVKKRISRCMCGATKEEGSDLWVERPTDDDVLDYMERRCREDREVLLPEIEIADGPIDDGLPKPNGDPVRDMALDIWNLHNRSSIGSSYEAAVQAIEEIINIHLARSYDSPDVAPDHVHSFEWYDMVTREEICECGERRPYVPAAGYLPEFASFKKGQAVGAKVAAEMLKDGFTPDFAWCRPPMRNG